MDPKLFYFRIVAMSLFMFNIKMQCIDTFSTMKILKKCYYILNNALKLVCHVE